MALCGFNEKMLQGLTAFNEWLVEHGLIHRWEKNSETMDQAIKRELSDMARLLAEIHRIDDAGKRILTEWLVKYVMWFYLIMRSKGADKIPDMYKETITNVGKYFWYMDDTYYGSLEGRMDDMEQLAIWLNEKSI